MKLALRRKFNKAKNELMLQKQKLVKSKIHAYLHIPKTGGTYLAQREGSAKPVLSPVKYLGHKYIAKNPNTQNPLYQVPPYDWPQNIILQKEAQKMNIFSTVRNLYDWFVSYWYHAGGAYSKYYRFAKDSHYDYPHAKKGFEYLLKTIANRDDKWPNRRFVFLQLFDEQGSLAVEWINRSKTLDSDLKEYARYNDLKYRPKKKQRVGRKGKDRDYRRFYDDKLVDLVASTYAREIKLFGFKFEGIDQPEKAFLKKEVGEWEKKHIKYNYQQDNLYIEDQIVEFNSPAR